MKKFTNITTGITVSNFEKSLEWLEMALRTKCNAYGRPCRMGNNVKCFGWHLSWRKYSNSLCYYLSRKFGKIH